LQDIQNGTPLPVAVGRALQTLAVIEVDAGRELVGFAAEFVSFQLNFVASLVQEVIAVANSFISGVAPTPAAPAVAKPNTAPRSTDLTTSTTNDDPVQRGDATVSAASATTERPKKPKNPKTVGAADDSVSATNVSAQAEVRDSSTTDPDDAVAPTRARDSASRADEASTAEQRHKTDAQKSGGKTDDSAGADAAGDG
jgi:hypothetical protein